jgi:peptidoglycan DL-endopeptidase RipA
VRRSGRVCALLALVALLGATPPVVLADAAPTAYAQPPVPPPPPPNPSDQDLQRSHDAVGERADEVGKLTNQLADLDSRTDDLQAALESQRETAQGALVDLQNAQDAAAAAQQKAQDARVATEAASSAIDDARKRLDDFVTSTYQQGIDSGPLGLLTEATSPDDLVARAEFNDLIAQQQLAAQDSLERARVGKANADSSARAALDAAKARQSEAQTAKSAADSALAAADAAARKQAADLAALASQRAQIQSRLDAAVNSDAGLRAQRDRYDAWQKQQAAEQAARDRAARDAAAARVAAESRTSNAGPAAPAPSRAGGNAVQRVIDRAMSQIGVQYVWGGGSGRGPTTGIPDGLGSPLNRIGFDCSGLMLYAFSGAGVSLPRVSRSQFNAGQKVPISQVRPGDMVFYADRGGPIHHVAMYIGNGKMIEAPYTGADVRVVPMRTKGLLSQATRVL